MVNFYHKKDTPFFSKIEVIANEVVLRAGEAVVILQPTRRRMDEVFFLTSYERRCSFSPSKREWGEVEERLSPDDVGKNQRARTHAHFYDQIVEENDTISKTNISDSWSSKFYHIDFLFVLK